MKQRLIDANKAGNALYGFTRYTGIDEAPYEHAETVIDKLPTVEAISVEWISEYAKRFDNDRGHSVQVTMDYAIESMLAEWNWEEENE